MPEFAGLTPFAFWFCFGALALGSAAQRISGQGYGLIAAPLVALVAPEMLPAGLLLLGLLSGVGSAALDLKAVNPRELPWGFAGRGLGAVVAAYLATLLPGFSAIATAVALLVLAAVGLSLWGVSVAIHRASLFWAGMAAGVMGTLTAIGAPPMAMLYQNEEPRRARAMQSTFFFFGMFTSIAALAIAGLIGTSHLRFAVACSPAILLGLLASQPLARHIPKSAVRPMALVFSTCAALILLAKIWL